MANWQTRSESLCTTFEFLGQIVPFTVNDIVLQRYSLHKGRLSRASKINATIIQERLLFSTLNLNKAFSEKKRKKKYSLYIRHYLALKES